MWLRLRAYRPGCSIFQALSRRGLPADDGAESSLEAALTAKEALQCWA